MPVLATKFIQGDETAYPDLEIDKIVQSNDLRLVVIDKGMKGGQPSVALRVDLPDGRVVISETSARLFCTSARMIMARYPNLFEGD